MEWINDHEIRLNNGAKIYSYDVNSKTGKKIIVVEEGAENQSFHAASNQVAYTLTGQEYCFRSIHCAQRIWNFQRNFLVRERNLFSILSEK